MTADQTTQQATDGSPGSPATSPSQQTRDVLLESARKLGESLRMDRPRQRKEWPNKPPVPVGRCGVSACAAECLGTCRTCCDTKWVAKPLRSNQPVWQTNMARCPDCEFSEDREDPNRQRRMTLSSAGFHNGREPIGTLASYNPLRQAGKGQQQARIALQAVKSWTLAEGPHLLVIVGNTGVGKTHLAEGATEYLRFTRRKQAVIVSGEDFVYELASYLSVNEENRQAYESRMRSVEFLVLDEVGIAYGKGGSHNEFVASLYQRVIGYRFNNGLPTMVTGNLASNNEIQGILGDRVFSRMQDSRFALTLTMWDAANLRPEMGKKR